MNHKVTLSVAIAFPSSNMLGEEPVWHDERQIFLWVDIEGQLIIELKWPGKAIETWPMPQMTGMIVVGNINEVIIALPDALARFNLETHQLELLTLIEKDIVNNRPNDGKCDVRWRLWLGAMDLQTSDGAGSLYCMDGDLSVIKKINALTISNGLAWSADHRHLYFIESTTFQIDRYLFDTTGAGIVFEKIVVNIPAHIGMPVGMSIDDEGKLWVAHWNGFAVRRRNPADGRMLATIQLPGPLVTSCTFGGENMDQLFITTAKTRLSCEELIQYPLSDHVFIAWPGVIGATANKFKSTIN